MSIRDELAEVIFNRSNTNGETYVDTLYQHEAYAFADAILEQFAVIEPPEPDRSSGESRWEVKGWGVDLTESGIQLARLPIDQKRARMLGVALIAASDQLEALQAAEAHA
jgi:hypothetical protein